MSDSHQIKHFKAVCGFFGKWCVDSAMPRLSCTTIFVEVKRRNKKLVRRPCRSDAYNENKKWLVSLVRPKSKIFCIFFQSYLVEMMLYTYFVSSLLFFVTLGKHYLYRVPRTFLGYHLHKECSLSNGYSMNTFFPFPYSLRRVEKCEPRWADSRICGNWRGQKCFDGM